jgi:glycosyltransferase involved in cell wall biosynthesis
LPTDDPFFSVVLATYNRGPFIVPTIESVLRQTFGSFELIVVGDACDDDTGDVVRGFASERIIWRNLAVNCGSQSGPNNEGQRHASGAWIAYIGHDDIWAPDHLAAIHALVTRDPGAAFVASGCIFHGPPDSGLYFVTGLFEESQAVAEHFCPPSALAHRRDVVARIGEWREPRSIALPVDREFQLRALEAGLRFASTGRVTVHKFAAGHRYLSYLRPEGHEQAAMLRRFGADYDAAVSEWVARSKATGQFMTMRQGKVDENRRGEVFERARLVKGLAPPPLAPLRGRAVIPQTNEPRALDWYHLESGEARCRWSGPNPRPKILIPFTGTRANVAIEIAGLARGAWVRDLAAFVEGERADYALGRSAGGGIELRLVAPLSADGYTILSLHTPAMGSPTGSPDSSDWRQIGVAVGDLTLSEAE